MATIDSRELIDTIIEHNGLYPGDEHMPIAKIIEYTNDWGNRTWGVVYEREIAMSIGDRYEDTVKSPHVHDPKVIWRRQP